MTKMKRAMGLAALLLGACILVGCSSPPADETTKPAAGGAGATNGGTPPGTNTNKSTGVKPQ